MTQDPTPKFNSPFEFDMALLEPIHEIMAEGILIDQAKKKEFQIKALQEWDLYQTRLDTFVGTSLNVDSKKFVPLLLYDILGLPKKTKKGKVKADEDALRSSMVDCKTKIKELKTPEAKMRWQEGYAIAYHVLKIRGIRKEISSYLGLKISKGELAGESPLEDKDGRIRGTISVGGTETARFSHSTTLWDTGCNLATIPRKLRSMFIAEEGYELAEFDLNRGESWVYAHLSEDPELLRIHLNGLDFHAETASAISIAFGNPLDVEWIIKHKDDEAYKIRYVGKRTNHATSYRMGPFMGADVINEEAEDTGVTVTVGEVKKAQKLWHNKYSNVRGKWWPDIENQLEEKKTLITPYGRIHQFHDSWGDHLFKSATAYIPQSTSVDYLNRGLLRVYHQYQKTRAWGLKILTQTHDSILIKYKIEHRDEVLPSVAQALMSKLVIRKREFHIPVDASYGPSWGEKKGYKLPSLDILYGPNGKI